MLVWFRTKGDIAVVGAGFGVSRSTAHRYRDEGVTVVSGRAPDPHETLEEVAAQGWSHVVLDGKVLRSDRCAATTTVFIGPPQLRRRRELTSTLRSGDTARRLRHGRRRYRRAAAARSAWQAGGLVQPGQDPTRRMDATRRFDGPPTERVAPAGHSVLGGRYRLDGLLGAGGMADVHRAEDLRLNRPVAVKVFRPGTDPDGERRFSSEARTLAGLRHPGLVAVHDFAVEGGRAYLVMELVDGPTLAAELRREPYDAESATRVGLELAQVLAYVHGEGVVHRDIKPSNVLVDHDGRMRLADFGIARLVDSSGLTSVDDAIGTMPYLAPEQVRGEPVGPPADIYALGLVLLESLSGRRVFPGDDRASAEQRLDRPPAVPSGLPEPLRGTLRAITDPDPRRRPDAREVAERLSRGSVEPPPARESGGGRRAALVALAVLALLVVVVFALTRGGDEPADVAAAPDTATSAPETTPEETAPEETASPGATEEGGDGGITIPDLPDIPSDLPDLPDIPTEIPQIPDDVQQDARNLWEQFTDWLGQFF